MSASTRLLLIGRSVSWNKYSVLLIIKFFNMQFFHTASYSVGSCKAYRSVNYSQRNGHCWVNAECGAQWLAVTPGDSGWLLLHHLLLSLHHQMLCTAHFLCNWLVQTSKPADHSHLQLESGMFGCLKINFL